LGRAGERPLARFRRRYAEREILRAAAPPVKHGHARPRPFGSRPRNGTSGRSSASKECKTWRVLADVGGIRFAREKLLGIAVSKGPGQRARRLPLEWNDSDPRQQGRCPYPPSVPSTVCLFYRLSLFVICAGRTPALPTAAVSRAPIAVRNEGCALFFVANSWRIAGPRTLNRSGRFSTTLHTPLVPMTSGRNSARATSANPPPGG